MLKNLDYALGSLNQNCMTVLVIFARFWKILDGANSYDFLKQNLPDEQSVNNALHYIWCV